MNQISHDIKDETIESKARWFRALPLSERMEMLCNFTDLALEINPDLSGNVDEILSNEITIFKDRVRIDVGTSTPGLRFQVAWKRRKTMEYRGQAIYVASREDLISSKRAAGRDVDLENVRLLELPDTEKDV